MRATTTTVLKRFSDTFDNAAAGMLPAVTASLTAVKTIQLPAKDMPTPVLWASIGIAEAGKSLTALLLAIAQYKNLDTFAKDFFSKVVAPAAWAVACAFAVMDKKLFGKPADAVLFAPAFAYNSAVKLISAANNYRNNKVYGNDLTVSIAMALLAVGVSGILFDVNPLVALTFAGALLNLFKNVICPNTTVNASQLDLSGITVQIPPLKLPESGFYGAIDSSTLFATSPVTSTSPVTPTNSLEDGNQESLLQNDV